MDKKFAYYIQSQLPHNITYSTVYTSIDNSLWYNCFSIYNTYIDLNIQIV